MWIRAAAAALLIPAWAFAQTPLSAIDWLEDLPSGSRPGDFSGRVLLEPPVTETGLSPQIETSELEKLAQPLGLVARNLGRGRKALDHIVSAEATYAAAFEQFKAALGEHLGGAVIH